MGDGELRQFRNQVNQIEGDVQDLRRQLQGAGGEAVNLRELEEVLRGLRAVGVTADPQSIQALTAEALEKLQKVEYDLRQKTETANEQLFIDSSLSQEVAPQFQKPVADYFRELSRRTGTKGGQ
jgi:DNA anti-recombination protein RmuC